MFFVLRPPGSLGLEEQKKKTNRIPTTDDDTAERDTLTQLTTHGGAAPCVPPVSTVDDCFICGGILVFFFVCQRPQNTVSDRCCCCCCCVGLLLRKRPSPPPHHGTIYYDEGELIPWLAAGCVCPALPLFTPECSTRFSFTISRSPLLCGSSSRFLVREITRRIYHIYFYIFESFIIFFSLLYTFLPSPPPAVLSSSTSHTCVRSSLPLFRLSCRYASLSLRNPSREHTPNPDHNEQAPSKQN